MDQLAKQLYDMHCETILPRSESMNAPAFTALPPLDRASWVDMAQVLTSESNTTIDAREEDFKEWKEIATERAILDKSEEIARLVCDRWHIKPQRPVLHNLVRQVISECVDERLIDEHAKKKNPKTEEATA